MKTLLLRIGQLLLTIHFLQCVGLEPVVLQHINIDAEKQVFVDYKTRVIGDFTLGSLTNITREYLVASRGTEIATDEVGTVILLRENEGLADYRGSIYWSNNVTDGNSLATIISSHDYSTNGRSLFDCTQYDSTNCLYGFLESQNYYYEGNSSFTNHWKVPLYLWFRYPTNNGYVYGWIRLNRQPYYGYGGPVDGIYIHRWSDIALSPEERLVFGPWVELKEGDEKVSGRPILPERKMSVSVQRGTTNSPPLVMVQVPPELCLKYELAVGNLKYGFASRHFDHGTPDRNRYTHSEPYSYALAVAVDSDYPFEWPLTLGRFDLKVTDRVWFLMEDNEFFVKLIPHVQYPQEKFLFPP